MDEIKYKLNSKNVMVITDAINLTIKSIIKFINEDQNSGTMEQYINILKEACTSENPMISSTGFQGLTKLIEGHYLKTSKTMNISMSIMITVKHYSGICSVISKILIMEVLEELQDKKSFTSKWHLSPPIHPFIVILRHHPDSIADIYNEITALCSPDSSIYDHCIEALRPIIMWILCNKLEPVPLYYQCKVLNLLFEIKQIPNQNQFLLECLGWQEISQNRCIIVYELYTIAAERAISNNDIEFLLCLLPVMSLILHELISSSNNPIMCINTIIKILDYIECNDESNRRQTYTDITLGLLANTILSCSVTYMPNMINICKKICHKSESSLSIYMVIAAFLQWEYNKNILTSDFNKNLRDLIMTSKNKKRTANHQSSNSDTFVYFKSVNKRIYTMYTFYTNFENIISNKEIYDRWLLNIRLCRNSDLICDHILFLQALLLMDYDSEKNCINKADIYKVTMNVLKLNTDHLIGHLPLTLHCLQMSTDCEETVALLQGLPEFAKAKENVPTVVDILKKLEDSKLIPTTILINLYTKLFEKQQRCYPYLQTVLVRASEINSESQWELLIAKSKAIKHICDTSALRHGTEVIPILSNILTQATTEETSLACCLCLKAIESLWMHEVIDPISTWQVLTPKLGKEKRDDVNISICNLLSLIPKLYHESNEYDALIDTSIFKLWKFIVDSPSLCVNLAAFKALSNYSLKFMSMRQIPDVYKEGVKLPPNVFKLQTEVTMTIDDMTYIPSNVWGNMFKHTKLSSLPGVVELCSSLMSFEIANYHTGLYNVSVEPDNVKYLPIASVVRGLMEYMRKEIYNFSAESSDNIFQCMKCLSMPFKNPLPPINWNFFSNLLHQQEVMLKPSNKTISLQLLAKQGVSSHSAMKILIDHLEFARNDMNKISEIKDFYTILYDICKYVKLTLFLPIVEETTELSYSLLKSNECIEEAQLFSLILKSISECLADEAINKNIKDNLAVILIKYWNIVELNTEAWNVYSDICCNLSDDLIYKITHEINVKSCYIRCKLAIESDTEDALDWLNDIIDAGVNSQCEHSFIIAELNKVLTKVKNESTIRNWILKFVAHVNRHLQEPKPAEVIEFICEILVTCVIALSEQYLFCYKPSEFDLIETFPQALNNFFSKSSSDIWKNIGCQILECLYRNRNNQSIPSKFAKSFNITIMASRHSSNFDNLEIWSKYIDTKMTCM